MACEIASAENYRRAARRRFTSNATKPEMLRKSGRPARVAGRVGTRVRLDRLALDHPRNHISAAARAELDGSGLGRSFQRRAVGAGPVTEERAGHLARQLAMHGFTDMEALMDREGRALRGKNEAENERQTAECSREKLRDAMSTHGH